MDRKSHIPHFPTLTPSKPYVDNYMEGTPRFIGYDPYKQLNTGVSQPIYDVYGDVNFSLPLDMYPPRRDVHRQIIQHNRQGDPKEFTHYNLLKYYKANVPSSQPWHNCS